MTRCESYPPCFGTIYFPTAPFLLLFQISVSYFTTRTLETPSIAFSSSSASLEAAHFRGALFEK